MSWTQITRSQYVREGLRYASDLTDAEWALIRSLYPWLRRIFADGGYAGDKRRPLSASAAITARAFSSTSPSRTQRKFGCSE